MNSARTFRCALSRRRAGRRQRPRSKAKRSRWKEVASSWLTCELFDAATAITHGKYRSGRGVRRSAQAARVGISVAPTGSVAAAAGVGAASDSAPAAREARGAQAGSPRHPRASFC
jgi:hypothetical protein